MLTADRIHRMFTEIEQGRVYSSQSPIKQF
jgi:hypothetical protein